MRKLAYMVIVIALFFAPVKRLEAGKLLPVRAVALYYADGAIVLETDTGNKGKGKTANEALDDLKAITPAFVYLETAEYLLVSEEATDAVEQLRGALKPRVKVCVCDAKDRVNDVAEYLDVHGELTELRVWKTN